MEYNPTILKVSGRPFYWKVNFADGTIISEYTKEGKEILYKEVLDKINNGGAVSSVEWYPTYEGLPVFKQIISEGQRPVVFRRNKIKGTGERVTIYAIGWQSTINGKNQKSITYIDLPRDTILITSED
jgi:hypothetical protein